MTSFVVILLSCNNVLVSRLIAPAFISFFVWFPFLVAVFDDERLI